MAVVQLTTSHDCGVSEAAPAVNQDGNDLLCSVSAIGNERWRFYLKWSLASVPAGSEILAVRIGLFVDSGGKEGTFPLELDFEQISTADWDETTITWDNQPGSGPPSHYQADQPDQGSSYWKWFESNSTWVTMVQDWLDGTDDNYGIGVSLSDEAPGALTTVQYTDSEGGKAPILEVEYYTAETIPGSDPGNDLDTYSGETNDRLDARDRLKAAHEVIWTVNSVENDITADLESIGSIRTVLPWFLESLQTGENVLIADNADQKYSPHDRDSILYQLDYVGTEIKIRTGLELRPDDKDMIEQYVGLVDYVTRNPSARSASIKTRPKINKLPALLVSVAYAAEDPLDALYDLCLNLLDLTTSDVSVKAFYDAKDGFNGIGDITKTYSDAMGETIAEELARAGQCSLYVDRRGRIAAHYWDTLTAAGTERTLSKDTNLTSIDVRERDDLIVNKVIINWGTGSDQLVATDVTSIGKYGVKAFPSELDMDLITEEDMAVSLANKIFTMRANPPIEVTCGMTAEVLREDVADQVLITEASEGFDEKVFVVTERRLQPGEYEGQLICMAPQ